MDGWVERFVIVCALAGCRARSVDIGPATRNASDDDAAEHGVVLESGMCGSGEPQVALRISGVPSSLGLVHVVDGLPVFAARNPGAQGSLCVCLGGERTATCLQEVFVAEVAPAPGPGGAYWALRPSLGDAAKRDVLRVAADLSRYDVVASGLDVAPGALDATEEHLLFGRGASLVARDVATGDETLLGEDVDGGSPQWIGHRGDRAFWTTAGASGLTLRSASLGRGNASEIVATNVAVAAVGSFAVAWMSREARGAEEPAARSVFVRSHDGAGRVLRGAPRRVYSLAVNGEDVWALGDVLARAPGGSDVFEVVDSSPTRSKQPATSGLFADFATVFYQEGDVLHRVPSRRGW